MRRIGTLLTILAGLGMTPVTAGELILTQKDLARSGTGPWVARDITGLPRQRGLPAVDLNNDSSEAQLLRRLVARGFAQGFDGILYDNRDRDHSTLAPNQYPNLTFLEYAPELKAQGLDYGVAQDIHIPAVVFGNSSTALTNGAARRSLTRLAMTTPGGAADAYRSYVSNSIYVYPEHLDHDAVDMFPANWPYSITSQGSSYSDRPFLDAVGMTLAAFSPDTRAALQRENLLPATVQMILRRNLLPVNTREEYLTGLAHPVVFDGTRLRIGRMIGQAAAMKPDEIPPMVRLKVSDETFATSAGLAGRDEHLFTTPSAIARIWRGTNWQHDMTVSAGGTTDPNGRDLTFEWVLLRGNKDLVNIEKLDATGTSARIQVRWHPEMLIPPWEEGKDTVRKSSRVDIGVFAWNGANDSAPAMITVAFPTHQVRVYGQTPRGDRHLVAIDYDAAARRAAFDPLLFWSARWTDAFSYADDGALTGWTRHQQSGQQQFDAQGRLRDGAAVAYTIRNPHETIPALEVVQP